MSRDPATAVLAARLLLEDVVSHPEESDELTRLYLRDALELVRAAERRLA